MKLQWQTIQTAPRDGTRFIGRIAFANPRRNWKLSYTKRITWYGKVSHVPLVGLGMIDRKPCEVCGDTKSQIHHRELKLPKRNNMTTDTLTLKKFLAEKLPDLLCFSISEICWRGKYVGPSSDCGGRRALQAVSDTEWLAIVQILEGKLTKAQQIDYMAALWKLHPDSSRSDLYNWTQSHLSQTIWWHLATADWPTRATALMEIL